MSSLSVLTGMNSGMRVLLSSKIHSLTSQQPLEQYLQEKQVLMQKGQVENMAYCCVMQYSQPKPTFSKGPEDRKVPLYSIDAINSRLFQLAGKIVSYLIVHLDIGIPCLSPAAYNYIATESVSPECCSVDDIVDLELKDLISKVNSFIIWQQKYFTFKVTAKSLTHFPPCSL